YSKETSTISGQPVLTLTTLPHLIDNVLVKQAPMMGAISKSAERSGLTMRLKIPKINVDAPIESVGIMANGEMGVPRGSNNVAWFNLGPYPGEIGSAVIDGHYGIWGNGRPAVFNDLTKLKIGDEIYIKDGHGSTSVFIIRELKSLDDNEDATGIFTSSDGKAHLNLITCSGKFNKVLKSYPKRLIVFSDKK
ncbi:MAG: class F sortase, partial [Patescibacteria group bacterium]